MLSDAPKSLVLRDPEVVAVLAGRATVRRPVKAPRSWMYLEVDEVDGSPLRLVHNT